MSMSTSVVGFIPLKTDKYAEMLAVYNACQEAGVELPKKVADFFNPITDNGDDPNNVPGVSVDLESHPCCQEYNEEMVSGFEIDVSGLPANVTVIRFCNSY